MIKKYVICLLFVCVLAVLFSGCGKTVSSDAAQTIPTSVSSVENTTVPETTEVPQVTEMTEPATESVPTEPAPTETTGPEFIFELSGNSIVLTEKGQTLDLYCGDVPLSDISWMSADESIALFSQGKVVAIDRGVTVVYAKYHNEIIFCEVICDVDPDAPKPYISKDLLNAPRMGTPYLENPEDTRFFDDAVFIGDSVSYVLQQWNLKSKQFGGAVFLTRSSLGLQNSIDGRMQLNYQGKSYSPEDAVALIAPAKVFVMLGYNDLALFGIDGTLERWEIFLNRILEKSPDVQIYIQSCTPMHKNSEYDKLNNARIDEYNAALETLCQERGYHFVNIAPYFKDFNNSLVSAFCSDEFVHITYDGAGIWCKALKAYAEEQMRIETEGETE